MGVSSPYFCSYQYSSQVESSNDDFYETLDFGRQTFITLYTSIYYFCLVLKKSFQEE